MNDQLRQLLNNRASTVKPAELTDGAIGAGRRLGHVRKTTASAVAAVAAMALAGGYFVLEPGTGTTAPADAGDGATWTAIPDTLTYRWYERFTAFQVSNGSEETIELPYTEDEDPFPHWQVSPDGRSISVADADGLRVGALKDGGRPPLAYKDSGLCEAQSWSPDSTQVMVASCDGDTTKLAIVDVASGDTKVIKAVNTADSAIWTADGKHLVWGDPESGYTIADTDGGSRRDFKAGEVSTDPADYMYGQPTDQVADQGVTAVSSDGRYVCHEVRVGADALDPDFVLYPGQAYSSYSCDALIDTTTGEAVTLPGDSAEWLVEAVFGPDGEILGRVWNTETSQFSTVLYDKGFDLIDSRLEAEVSGNAKMGSYTR